MKNESNQIQKPNTIKKPLKPLNDKKSTINTQLNKDKLKKTLTINNEELQINQFMSKQSQNMKSPKNNDIQQSLKSTKNIIVQNQFVDKKSPEFQCQFNSPKKQITTQLKFQNKNTHSKRNLNLIKHEPIRKQNLKIVKSPRNAKSPSIIQSESFLNVSSKKNNQESSIMVQMQTSLAVHTENLSSSKQQLESTSNILSSGQNLQLKDQDNDLLKTSNSQKQQIKRLKQQNQLLQQKYKKLKINQQENRKKLKERISSYNQEGEEIIRLKNKIAQIQKENQLLKCNKLNQKAQTFRISQPFVINVNNIIKQVNKIDQCVMTQPQNPLPQGMPYIQNDKPSPIISQQISLNSIQKSKSDISSQTIIHSLQIQTIKSSYEQRYKKKIELIQQKYDETVKDLQIRYKALYMQMKSEIKQQQNQLCSLQSKLDCLYERLEECTCEELTKRNKKLNIDSDSQELKRMLQINQLRQKISRKDEEIKKHREDIQMKEIQMKKTQAELDNERIKFSLVFQVVNQKNQLQKLRENQQLEILREQLRQQKQIAYKLRVKSQKKQELIKKLSLNQVNLNKKIPKK